MLGLSNSFVDRDAMKMLGMTLFTWIVERNDYVVNGARFGEFHLGWDCEGDWKKSGQRYWRECSVEDKGRIHVKQCVFWLSMKEGRDWARKEGKSPPFFDSHNSFSYSVIFYPYDLWDPLQTGVAVHSLVRLLFHGYMNSPLVMAWSGCIMMTFVLVMRLCIWGAEVIPVLGLEWICAPPAVLMQQPWSSSVSLQQWFCCCASSPLSDTLV